MGLITALKSVLPWLQTAAPWTTASEEVTPTELGRENYWAAYDRHARTRACIDLIADGIASLPLVVEAGSNRDWQEVDESNDLAALLGYVNPRQDWYTLLKHTVIALLLYGNAYWELVKDGSSIRELYCISEAIASVEVNLKDGNVTGYRFQWTSGGPVVEYPADEIVNFCLPNPLSPSGIVGASAIAPIATLIEQDWAAMKYNLAYFDNGASPGNVLVIKGNVNKDQREAVRKDFESRFGNKKGPHRTMVVGADGAELLRPGDNPTESSFLATHEAIKADIAEVFGVPISLLESNAANYATAREDTRHFYANRIFPLATLIECAINEQLANQYGEGLRVRFDTNLPDLALDGQMQKAEMSALLTGGKPIMTVDKARELFWELGPLSEDPGYEEPQPVPPVIDEQKVLREHFPDNKLAVPTKAKLAELVKNSGN